MKVEVKSGRNWSTIASIAAILVSSPACTTAWYSAWKDQQNHADAFRPAALSPAPPTAWNTATQRFRVRIWADDDYRAQAYSWQSHIERQVSRVNEAMQNYGIVFEIAAAKPWQRRSAASLADDLRALDEHDHGDGADLVVGFVSASPVFASSIHQLGMTTLMGKHIVLRGMHDASEYDHLMKSFSMMSESDMQDLYYQRKWHKEAAAFIHEFAHTLGAAHVQPTDDFMHAVYSHEQNGFSALTAAILGIGLDIGRERDTPQGKRRWSENLLALLETNAKKTSVDAEQQALIDFLKRMTEAQSVTPVVADSESNADAIPTGNVAVGVASEVRIVTDDHDLDCSVLGSRRIDYPDSRDIEWARQLADADVRLAAVKAGGNTVAALRKTQAGKTYVLATIYRCSQ